MPHFHDQHPRLARKFADHEVSVPAVFAPGHTLSDAESKWMNSQLATVTGNAFAGSIRRALEAENTKRAAAHKAKKYEGPMDETGKKPAPATFADLGWNAQEKFNEVFSNYTLGESNRGTGAGTSKDPIDQLIRTFSVMDIKARLAKKNLTPGPFYKAPSSQPDVYKSKWEELVGENIKAKHDEFKAQAEAQLVQLAGTDTEQDDLIDSLEAPQAEAA
jgi:hypothetical protein